MSVRIIFILIILLFSCDKEKDKLDFVAWENYLGDKGRIHYVAFLLNNKLLK